MSDLPRALDQRHAADESFRLPAALVEREWDMIALLSVLGRYKRVLFAVPVVVTAITAIVTLIVPVEFTAATRILTPQQNQSTAAALLSQFGGAAGIGGALLGIKNPSDLYIGILKSNTVADRIIARLRLKDIYRAGQQIDARTKLAKASRFTPDRSGLIAIEADARDPKLAADIANAYVEELHYLTTTLAVTEASQRRLFFERQLEQSKERLAESEIKLRQAMSSGGFVSVDAQSRAAMQTVAQLRAQITAKEIEIRATREYTTSINPERQRAEQQLASMRQELARLESGSSLEDEPRDGAQPDSPKGIANIRLLRDIKYNEFLLELVTKQYELARIEEAKEAPVIQVVDRASPPERRSYPRRLETVLIAFIVATIASVVLVFLLNAYAEARADPTQRVRLAAMRDVWLRRRT